MQRNRFFFETPLFTSSFKEMKESVLDFPKSNTLCTDVWEIKDNTYHLTETAKKKIKNIAKWVINEYKLKNPSVRIIGSICSNTYKDDSDIDIHFSADNITKANKDDLNKKGRSEFLDTFGDSDDGKIKKHPFEIYFQYNKYQDEMSVGCFDVLTDKWISGPEILDNNFNPYSEYYDGIMKHLSDIAENTRLHILKCGEVAAVVLNVVDNVDNDDKFLKKMSDRMTECINVSKNLVSDIKDKRTLASEPKSSKIAHNKRESEEWKIADSSFKFLDKLGYIATLVSISKCQDDDLTIKEVASKIISSIHENLFNLK